MSNSDSDRQRERDCINGIEQCPGPDVDVNGLGERCFDCFVAAGDGQ